MKKIHCILITVLLTIALAGCAAPSAATAPSSTASPDAAVVTFADPVLEDMLRGALGLPQGGITLAQAQAVTRLDLSNEYRRYLSEESQIKDISGLENFTNLETLDFSYHWPWQATRLLTFRPSPG